MTFQTLGATALCPEPVPGASCEQAFAVTPAGQSILMIAIDVLVYFFLAWWLHNVWQGEYGTAKPWNFCLLPHSVCPQLAGGAATRDAEAPTAALSIRNLRKVFKGGQVAVDDMTMEV